MRDIRPFLVVVPRRPSEKAPEDSRHETDYLRALKEEVSMKRARGTLLEGDEVRRPRRTGKRLDKRGFKFGALK